MYLEPSLAMYQSNSAAVAIWIFELLHFPYDGLSSLLATICLY